MFTNLSMLNNGGFFKILFTRLKSCLKVLPKKGKKTNVFDLHVNEVVIRVVMIT